MPGGGGGGGCGVVVVGLVVGGYGDHYPQSVEGRVVGMALMFVGIGFLPLLDAAVAARFVREERGDEQSELMDAPADRGPTSRS
jgi:hypothetical protein